MRYSGSSQWYILDNNPIIRELTFIANYND